MQIINNKTSSLCLILFLLLTPLVIPVQAKEPQQSDIVLRESITTIDTHEGLITDVSIPANASMPRHQHPGDEFLYMLAGEVMLTQDGLETIVLTAGQGYRIPAGRIHTPKGGADGARAIVFRVHPEGEAVTNLVED